MPSCGAQRKSPVTSSPMGNPGSATKRSISASTPTGALERGTVPALSEGAARRYGGRERCGTIPNQGSIKQRPAFVDSHERFGDWEAGLVVGASHYQTLVALNERKSRYALIAHVPAKTTAVVSNAMISMLTAFAACVHTQTSDNGRKYPTVLSEETSLRFHHSSSGQVAFAMHRLNHRPPENASPSRLPTRYS